jgi:YVTN family beta-propeller protein
MRGRLHLGAWLAVLALVACLDPVDPTDAPVAAVQVTFDGTNTSDTITVRGTTRARAAAIARQGYDLGRTDFTFTSSNEAVAIVEATGVVRAINPGTAVIRATLPGGIVGEGEVMVVPTAVEYDFAVGNAPGAMTFSPDYARLYVVIAPDSLAIVDALGYARLSAVPLRAAGTRVAATAQRVYVTHPGIDSVSLVSSATNAVIRRIAVGSAPTGAAATADRAFLALRGDRAIAVIDGEQRVASIGLAGAPHELAVARDGRRLFATMETASGWRLTIVDPAIADTVHSLALTSAPGPITTDLSGQRVYVLLPSESRVAVFVEGADGRYQAAGSVAVAADAGGISARLTGAPLVVVSGSPVTVFDGVTLALSEQVANVGTGHVAVRPDGVFAYISSVLTGTVRVIGL